MCLHSNGGEGARMSMAQCYHISNWNLSCLYFTPPRRGLAKPELKYNLCTLSLA